MGSPAHFLVCTPLHGCEHAPHSVHCATGAGGRDSPKEAEMGLLAEGGGVPPVTVRMVWAGRVVVSERPESIRIHSGMDA